MSDRYILTNRLGSGGFVVEAMLRLAGLNYDYDPLQSRPNESLKNLVKVTELNPWGQVPILQTPNKGSILTEVAAIIIYLTQNEHTCRNGPHLWLVEDERTGPDRDYHSDRRAGAAAQMMRWCVFLSVNVYEGILRQSYPRRYFESTQNEEKDNDIAERIQKGAKKKVHEAFVFLEEHVISVGDADRVCFLLGQQMSGCDIFLAMLYAWHNKQDDLPKCTAITRRVATHELIRPIWKRNFHDRLDYKWHELEQY